MIARVTGITLLIVTLFVIFRFVRATNARTVKSELSTPSQIKKIAEDAAKPAEQKKQESEEKLDDKVKEAEKAGLVDKKEFEDDLKKETEKVVNESPSINCAIKPNMHLGCGENFVIDTETGCCALKPGREPSASELKLKLAKAVGTEIVVGLVAGEALEVLIKRGPQMTAAAVKVAGKAIAKMAPRIGASIAAAGAKYSATMSAGPPGWIVSAIMLAFDAISLTLDLLDVDGYDSYTSNSVLANTKKLMDYASWKAFNDAGMDYPAMFPLTEAYKNEFEAAQEFMAGEMFNEIVTPEIKKTPEMNAEWEKFLLAAAEDPNAEFPATLVDFTTKTMSKFHKERDLIIFNKMQELLGDEKDNVELYEFMSTPTRIGVSLSRKGAQEWNEKQREIWFKHHDLFKPPEKPIDFVDPSFGLYTDTYYVLDKANPGDEKNPNMIPKKLPGKAVISGPYGMIVAYCEKRRQMKGISEAVDPAKLGVKFNMETGVCDFTKKFCQRYGLEFKGNNCKTRPGQKFAETVLGKTVTRASIREWDRRKDLFRSGDPAKIAQAYFLTTLDPTGLKTAAVKKLVKELSEAKPKKTEPAKKVPCPPGTRDDGTSCWKDTVPKKSRPAKKYGCNDARYAKFTNNGKYKMRDDGTSCWLDTVARKSRPAMKYACNDKRFSSVHKNNLYKLRDDGTSCWLDTLAKKSRPAKKYSCNDKKYAGIHKNGRFKMRDDGTSCWLDTLAKKSRPAKKRSCYDSKYKIKDYRVRDDGTSCWVESYGRGAGTIPKSKGGNCWGGKCKTHCEPIRCSKWKGCSGGKCKTSCEPVKCAPIKRYCTGGRVMHQGLCYKKCKSNYKGVGPVCHPNIGAGIKVTLGKRQYCPSGYRNVAGICWQSCPSGYKDIGALCHPPGGPGIKVTVGKRWHCDPGQKNIAGICWSKCPSGYKDIGALCHPPGGPGIKVTLGKRWHCKEGQKNVAGICWSKCPQDYKNLGLLCEPPGGPGIKVDVFKRQHCEPGQKNIAGICWSKCPDGYKDLGAICEPPGGPHIAKDLFKRQVCPPNYKNVGGVCWSKCPPGYRDDGAICNKN